ncbi:MAG: hypothetical protein J6S67_15760 [Methanobrevibacter sp.]|nr:hypothetical protein [Methanobrevibacter sp.]
MIPVKNEDIELMIEINRKLNDPRVSKMIERWMIGRDENRKKTREIIAKRRKENKNYAREKKNTGTGI